MLALSSLFVSPGWANSISVNFYHTSGIVADAEKSGIVPVAGWNNLQVPGGFGLHDPTAGFGPIVVDDVSGTPAAAISSTLASYYNGDSGGSTTGLGATMMSEYVSWDTSVDGVLPDDTGTITISDLGAQYTDGGYDVYLYFDTDANDRTHTITIDSQVRTGADASTFNGVLARATGGSSDANYAVFESLTASSFSISMDASSGRGALNGIQIVSSSYIPSPVAGPNVLLFVVDDMGWQDLSVPLTGEPTVWNGLYQTPQLDTLAGTGMRFTNAYAASPVCSPSRASMMTGRNPARTGITNWLSTVGRNDGNSVVTDPIWTSQGLQPDDGNTTLPSILHEAGYLTAHVGKAHMGAQTTQGADPTTLGFDINVGGSAAGNAPTYFPDYGGSAVAPGLEAYWSAGTYLNDALTSEATKIIDQAIASGQSFFMNMAHYAVHTPIEGQGDPAFLPTYASRPTPEDDYAAMLESVDASLAVLVEHLQTRGIADETLIVFISDNGGLSRFLRYDSPDPGEPWHVNEHNRPLASGKGSAHEGGLRVPMIVSWAGQDSLQPPIQVSVPIVPGAINHEPVHTDDLFATLLHVAGIPSPESHLAGTDGENLVPLLSGQPFVRGNPLYFHYPHQWLGEPGIGPGIEPFTAVREGRWKLIYYWSGRSWALYDLETDLGETTNVISRETGVVHALGTQMIAWLVDVGAQLPRDAVTLTTEPLPILPAPGCNDGIDNDGDGFTDDGADPGCTGLSDTSEWDAGLPCDNGLDDDGDGLIDLQDPDCADPLDVGEGGPTAIADGGSGDLPRPSVLHRPRPNPFNPQVEISFALESATMTRIDIYDIRGRLVDTLLHGVMSAGTHRIMWRGEDRAGANVASGVYFLRMVAGERIFRERLTLLR